MLKFYRIALIHFLIIMFVYLFSTFSVFALVIPPYIHYQGRLVDQVTGAPFEGVKNITFSLYDIATGRVPIYRQTQEVNIIRGAFSVYIGQGEGFYDGNAVADGIPAKIFTEQSARYLGIWITGSPTEMLPRQIIGSAAYAYKAEKAMIAEEAERAKEAEGLTGISLGGPGGIATLDENGIVPNHQLSLGTPGGIATLDENGTIPSDQLPGITVDSAGNVGIGTSTPSERLDLGGGKIKMGYQIVYQDLITQVDDQGHGYASLYCPEGKRALGGGCRSKLVGPGDPPLIQSHPTDGDGTGWSCSCESNPGRIVVWAICANIE